MKRFTETQKWEDPWFRKLKPEMKLLWQWILDRCDNAGVIDPDIDLASFQIGYAYPMDTLSEFAGRVVKMDSGKYFIPKFIEFQYGQLSVDCRAHGPVFKSLERNGIDPSNLKIIGYPKGIHTLQDKDKDTEKEKVTEKEEAKEAKPRATKTRATLEEVIEFVISLNLPQSDGEATFHKWEGNGWTNSGKPIKCWKSTIRSWNAGKFLPSQKPKGGFATQPSLIPPTNGETASMAARKAAGAQLNPGRTRRQNTPEEAAAYMAKCRAANQQPS